MALAMRPGPGSLTPIPSPARAGEGGERSEPGEGVLAEIFGADVPAKGRLVKNPEKAMA